MRDRLALIVATVVAICIAQKPAAIVVDISAKLSHPRKTMFLKTPMIFDM
ncbi:MAG: hypothetical protein IBX58_06540 [Roseovarius sp.]|nr:hypothetical protein [Roseovarius sp.]